MATALKCLHCGDEMEVLLLILLVALYFLPGIIASRRHHSSAGGIWVVNIFLGWTFLGWVIALAWAASGRHTAHG